MTSKRDAARTAASMALRTRMRAKVGLTSPVNPFDACARLNVEVRFANIPSMEGMLATSPRLTIIVSGLRPSGRQAFTCAHELGHLVLNHGAVVDDLSGSTVEFQQDDLDEFAADTFAAFFLMPKTAVQSAMSDRGIDPARCEPARILELAQWFGVGFATMVNHLRFGLSLITFSRHQELRRLRPKKLREEVLGAPCSGLTVVDRWWTKPNVDVRCGETVWFTDGLASAPMEMETPPGGGSVVVAAGAGVHSVTLRAGGNLAIRAMRADYEGRSIYRYLPEDDE